MTTDTLCKRCKKNEAVYVSRKEPFCKECFVRFLRGKQRKQMAEYKVSYDQSLSNLEQQQLSAPRVLLALSLSESSLSLLEMLVSLLHEQRSMHRGRSGFELFVIHVDQSEVYPYAEPITTVMDRLQDRFGQSCVIKKTGLNSIFESKFAYAQQFTHNYLSTSDYVVSDIIDPQDHTNNVKDLLSSIRDRTSKLDIIESIRQRLILQSASDLNCSTILWGDSMTRIAEKTLSLTAKGRGSSLPHQISDTVKQGISHIYSLREVLRAETEQYVDLLQISDLVAKPAIAMPNVLRMMTIDDLMVNYFADIETAFPSIVSTVVRTADKLADPIQDIASTCFICGVPCEGDQDPGKWLTDITVNEPATTTATKTVTAASEVNDSPAVIDRTTESLLPSTQRPVLCYGCLIATKNTSFPWVSLHPRPSKQEILNEFELHD
ncbi:hypothetical protein V1514DRAFT_311969 [Lipomyces japonicus]|uniref:uncharacterized protein n=1 Tax=Lipomyces japonicus TaxID=56871 RepID=UPI0034CE754E